MKHLVILLAAVMALCSPSLYAENSENQNQFCEVLETSYDYTIHPGTILDNRIIYPWIRGTFTFKIHTRGYWNIIIRHTQWGDNIDPDNATWINNSYWINENEQIITLSHYQAGIGEYMKIGSNINSSLNFE